MKDATPFIQQFNFLYFDVGPSAVEPIVLELEFENPSKEHKLTSNY